jgi:hypothetical protein
MNGKKEQKMEKQLKILENDLLNNPCASLLLAAWWFPWIVDSASQDEIPTWVWILANGNLDKWEAVVDEARYWLVPSNEE